MRCAHSLHKAMTQLRERVGAPPLPRTKVTPMSTKPSQTPLAEAQAEINRLTTEKDRLRSDRDCEKRMRKDAEERAHNAEEKLRDLALQSISSDAQQQAEIERLKAALKDAQANDASAWRIVNIVQEGSDRIADMAREYRTERDAAVADARRLRDAMEEIERIAFNDPACDAESPTWCAIRSAVAAITERAT